MEPSLLVHVHRNLPDNPDWEGSFYEQLFERGEWDESEFWLLHTELIQLARSLEASREISKEIAHKLFKIYARVLGLIAAHFDPNDLYVIEDIESSRLSAFKERLDSAFGGVFSGKIPPESSFTLKNPQL